MYVLYFRRGKSYSTTNLGDRLMYLEHDDSSCLKRKVAKSNPQSVGLIVLVWLSQWTGSNPNSNPKIRSESDIVNPII